MKSHEADRMVGDAMPQLALRLPAEASGPVDPGAARGIVGGIPGSPILIDVQPVAPEPDWAKRGIQPLAVPHFHLTWMIDGRRYGSIYSLEELKRFQAKMGVLPRRIQAGIGAETS